MDFKEIFVSDNCCGKEKKKLSSFELDQLRFALEDIEPSIQDLNAVFEFNEERLIKDTLSEILGKDCLQKVREAVYVTMIDSVNLHDDEEMIEEQELDREFVIIVVSVNTPDHLYDLSDRAYYSELIHASSDNKIVASPVQEGNIISFDATKPHAYLHAEGQSEDLLILSFDR